MKSEEFLCRDIVLRKRPLQILGSLLQDILGQHELIGSHLFHDDLIALRIRRVSHDLKSHLVLGTQTAGALRVDLATLDLHHLVAKEHAGHTIKLEALERVLTTHIQQKIHAQATRGIPIAKIVLAGRKLKCLLGNMSRILGFAKLGLQTSKLDLSGNLKNLTAIHEVTVIKAKCVLSADDIGVGLLNVLAEGKNKFPLRRTAHKLGIRLDASQNEHSTSRRFQKITRRASTDADLNDRISIVLRGVPLLSQKVGIPILQSIHHTRKFKK